MSQADESNVTNNSNQETSVSPNLATSIIERMTRGRRLVSPWVQRALLQTSAGTANLTGQPQPRLAGLTTANTSALLNRLQRSTDEGAIWQPDVGSLNPHMVGGFTNRIVSRFTDTETETQAREPRPVEETDFALAGAWGESDATESVEESSPALPFTVDDVRQALQNKDWSASTGVTPTPPSGSSASSTPPVQRKTVSQAEKGEAAVPFTLEEVRAALETPHFTRSDQAASPPVQRQPERPAVSPPTGKPTHIPKRRLVSRVEEIDPSAAKSSPSSLPMPPLSPEPGGGDSAPVQRQADHPSPPSPAPAQKKIAADAPSVSPPSGERRPSLPVQRQTAPETASSTPAVPKTPEDSTGQEPPAIRPSSASVQRQSETSVGDGDVDVAADAVDERSALSTPESRAETVEPSPSPVQRQSDLPLSPRLPAQPGLSRPSVESTESSTPSAEPSTESSAASEGTAPSSSSLADVPTIPVQRQVEPTPPASLSSLEEEEDGDEVIGDDAEHQATSVSAGQRQPEGDLPLKSSLPPAQAQAVQKQSESPEATDKTTASVTESSAGPSQPARRETSAAPPPVQRQADVTEPSSASSPETASATEHQADVSAKGTGTEPPIQRQAETEMPLQEGSPVLKQVQRKAEASDEPVLSTGETATETDQPARRETPTAPPTVQRQTDVTEPSSVSSPEVVSATEDQADVSAKGTKAEPPIQRQTEAEMPLREGSPVLKQAQRKTEAIDEPALSTDETTVEIDESVTNETSAAPPTVQRQTDVTEPSSVSSPEVVSATEHQADVSAKGTEAEPIVQRQADEGLPLRESSPVLKQVQRKTEASDEPASSTDETTIEIDESVTDETSAAPPMVQRQADVTEPSSVSSPEVVSATEHQVEALVERTEAEPIVQRQADEGLPLREGSPVLKQVQRKTEASDEPASSTDETTVEIDESVTDETSAAPPTVQRQADVTEPSSASSSETVLAAEHQVEASVERTEAEPIIQRQAEAEMPLRESSPVLKQVQRKAEASDEPASSTGETAMETDQPTRRETSAAPPTVQRQTDMVDDEMSEVPSTETEAAIQRQVETSSEAAAQRETVEQPSPLPLRQRSISSRPSSSAESSSVQRMADETSTTLSQVDSSPEVDLNKEIFSKAEAGSRLPLNKLPSSSRPHVAQTKPLARTGVLPQAKGERETGGESLHGESVDLGPPLRSGTPPTPAIQRSSLPLAKPQRIEIVDSSAPPTQTPPPSPPVQRQVAEPASTPVPEATTSPDADVVQREPDESPPTAAPPGEASPQSSKADLEKLARQVYPEIKRMLARERDRSVR